MKILPVSDQRLDPAEPDSTQDGAVNFDKLQRLFTELSARQKIPATPEEVDALALQATELHTHVQNSAQEKSIVFAVLSRLGMYSELYKIKKFQKQIADLRDHAQEQKEKSVLEKKMWHLKRKGFLYLNSQEVEPLFQNHLSCMTLLHSQGAFTFTIESEEAGRLVLHVYSVDTQTTKTHHIHLKKVLGAFCLVQDDSVIQFESIEALLNELAHQKLPLSQLQDIALWLEAHGMSDDLLPLQSLALEEKLEARMKASPQTGSYLLTPSPDSEDTNCLILWRVLPRGQLSSLKVDLQKQLGAYTFVVQGKFYSATRSEFVRKLGQSGAPLRLRTAAPAA